MACDFRTFSVLQGSFLFPVLLTISLFSGIYSQTSLPGNPNLAGDYEKNEGETVTLSCSAIGGNPLPSVQWYKNQQLVDPGSSSSGNGDGIYTVGSSTVTYNNYTFTVSRSDNLVSYICKVQNSLMASPLERAWTISIYVPSEQPFISGPDPAITTALNSGSTYKYICTAQNGRPAPNLRWKLGTSLSSAVEFHQGITENTTTNADSTLSKSSTLSWVPIVDDNGKNLYCQTDQTTAGAGAIQKSTSVPIVVQQIPILQIGSSSYTAQVGSSVTLSCRVISATPAITDLFWRRQVNGVYTRITIDNNRFFGGSTSNANLTISNVALSDQTSYQCSATNSAGTGNSGATTLSVSGSAPLVQIDQDKYPSTSGNTVTLVCDVYSSLTVSEVYWQRAVGGQFTRIDVSGTPEKYGGVTVSSPSLVVKSVTTGDAGEYRCVAVNIAGTGQDTTILEVQGNLPRVTIEKDSYTVNEGNTVTLACTVLSSTSSNVISVLWQTIENGVSSTLNVNDPSKYSGASVSNPSLTIFNAESSDNGQYRCTATNTVGTGESAITTLKVIAKPVFRITQNSYTVNYGTNVTLQVTISSPDAPVLAVNWQHTSKAGVTNYVLVGGGKYDGATVGSPSLKILSSTFEDEGTYRCLVTSSAGSTTSGPISLTVIGNVPSVVIGSGSAVVYGGQVTISCSISSNPSAQSMSWQKTFGGVTTTLDISNNPRYQGGTLSNPSLTISNVNLDDKGDYRCLATNIVGTGQSGPAVIDVTGGVPTVTTGSGSTVYVGDNATVTCIVSGTPAAISVSWQRTINSVTTTVNLNNFSKYSGGTLTTPSLSIFNVSKEDEGSYSCQATNVIGTGQSVTSAFLSVIGSAPVTIIGPDISVTVGDQATISCSVTGYPLSTAISWQRIASGVRSNVDTSQARFSGGTVANPSLTINPVEGSDEGDYQCSATNYLGTSQSGTAYLDVMGSIPSVQIPSSSYTVAYSSQIRLQCVVNSIPPATSIGWIKTQQGVTTTINVSLSKYSGGTISDPSLRIYDADLSDEGSYVCSATNIVGTGTSQEMSLSVVVSLPTVQVGSSGYSGITGGTVLLVCSIISSNPSATSVIWEKDVNGVPTDVTSLMASRISGGTVTQPSLTISSLTAGDTGTYYCSAANSVGRGSRSSTTLTVQSRPSIVLPAFTYNAQFGQNVILACNVTSATTLINVVWRKYSNGVPNNLVVTGSSHYSGGSTFTPSLTILTLTFSDSGNYDCSATNVAGTTTSSQMTLNVIGTVPSVNIPQTSYSVTYGGTVTLGCVVNSNPFQNRVEWQRIANGVSTTLNVTAEPRYSGGSINTPSLTITGAVSGDAGVYVCSATNDAGKGVSGQTVLSVQGNLPQVRIAQSQYSVLYGGSVYMECTVENAVPPVTAVRWYKGTSVNHFNLSIDVRASKYSGGVLDNPSLNITNVVPSDEGFYSCNATNLVGTASAWTFFDVYGDIPSITLRNTSYSVMVGDPVTLACDYNSSPAPTAITWQRIQNAQSTNINVLDSRFGGGTIVTPYLTIRTTLLSDAGVYTCSVTNHVGTTTGNPIFLFINGSTPSVSIPQSTYNVSFGDPITIPCNVTAVPTATNVSWVKTSNGVSVTLDPATQPSKYSGSTVSNPSLTISSTNLTDEGNYVCSASNTVGTGSSNAAFLDVIGDVPAVSVSQTSYSIFVGSSVTLNCFVSGNPAVSFVFWTVTRNGFTQNAQDGRYSNGDINNPSLTINNARQSDTGVFVCKAQNSAGTTDSSPISLTVSGTSPNVTMAQSSYSVFTNGDVTLSCFVSANPSASISWTFTSNSGGVTAISASTSKYSLATSTTASSLTVLSANSNDQGSYTCSATNSVGTGQATATLVVSGSLPSINLPSTYSVITGNDVTMTCTVSANPAVSSVFWQFRAANGFSFTNITATFKYSISSLTGTSSLTVRSTTSSDNGQYRCQATNQVGTSQSTTVLTVSGSVPVVNIPQNSYSSVTGQDVQIPCSVSANPTATITWTFISTSQSQTSITTSTSKYTFNPSSTDGTLRIRSTSSSDTGTYRCQATNAVGTSSDSASLSVSGSPPSVNFGSSSYSVTTGQSIQLVCFVSASPTATDIAWTFQSNTGGGTTTITSSTSGYSLTTTTSYTQSTLTVLSAQSSNGGTYTCRATNLVGTRSASVSLSVSGNIPTVTIPQNSYSVVTGQDVQIPCSVSASPSASISWIFISTSQSQITISSSTFKYTFNPSSTDGTLTVRTTTSGDTGTYRCQATNAVGTASDSATLSVSGSLPLVTIPQNSYSVVTGQDVQIPCSVSASPSASISWIFTSTSQSQITISSSTSKYTFNPTSTDGALRIRSTSSSDTGTYRCQATNAVGTSSDSATLSVTGSAPSVNFGTSSYSVTTGQSIQMVCFVSASPTATDIAWTFQSNTGGGTTTITSSTSGYSLTTTTSNTQSTLTVLSAQSSNGGTYTCRATNLVGTRSASASLSVSGNIPTVTIPQNSYSVVTGQDVQIPCSVSASPSASISWIFISTSQSQITISSSTFKYTFNPTSTDGTLTVRSTTSSDTGTYRCQATNAVGTASDSASLSVSGSLPSVTITQTTYSVITGSNQQIPCFVSANPTASAIGWTFRSATSGTTVTITSSTSGYSIVTSSTSQSTLTVLAADNNDEGTYTCQATNQVGNGSDSAFLDVTGSRPTVNIQQNTYSSVSGQDVTISCVVSSNPTASISWIFISTGNSQTQITTSNAKYSLTTSSGGSTLVVRNSNSGDSGTYRCTATNTVGSASDSASLTVSGSLPVVNIPSSIYTVVTGQDATIPCSVSANPAVTSSSWTFISASSSQTMITQSTSKYTLSTSSGNMTLVVRGTSSADSGTYRCSATNAEGTASDQTSLTVSGSTPVVDISQNSYTAITGNNVVIPCTVSASPAATSISWRFTSSSGSEIQITSSSSKYSLSGSNNFPQLTIQSVGPSDSGTYRCSATNLVGTSSDTASLTVTGSRPVVTIPSSNYNVIVGNSVTLPCTISASPSVTAVSWFFTSNSNNQIQITSSSIKYTVSRAGSEYNLTVSSAISSDAGVYECRATNAIDTSIDSTRLDVSGSIPVVTLPTTLYERTYGQNVTMQCSVTATPDITEVRWQRFVNGAYQDIFTQSSTKYYGSSITNFALTVTNLVFTDAGEYRCTATNQVGRGVSPNRATLSVLGAKPSVIAPQNSYSAVIGTNVTLACVVSVTSIDPPVLTVVWRKMTPSGSGTIDVSGSQKYGGSTTASPDLVIANLDVHDNGNYSCLATNAAGTSESGTIVLTVTGSQPTPFIPLTSYSVLIGNDIQIPCTVSANPAATLIQWQFTSNSGSSTPISQNTTKYTLVGDGTTTSNLTINSAALTDAGTYRCSATNIVGTGSDSATLTITGIAPNVTIPDTSLSVQKRQNITIACEVTDALPKETSVLWEFRANQGDSGTIISVDGNPTKYQGGTVAVPSLTILSVAASDEGYYTCIASNVFGEGRSEQAFLEATGNAATVTVSPPSQSVLQKSTAIIQCIINNANPGVTEVSWEKINSGTTSSVIVTGRFNGSTPSLPDLIISDLQPSDAGTYYCSARNAIGTSRSSTGSNLIVTGAVPNNVQILGATSQTVNLGGSLTLQCSGQGNPAPTLSWIFSSSTSDATEVGTGTTYSITNAQRTNGGTYVCRGTNSLGSTDSQGVTVDVQYAPIDARTDAQKSLTAAIGSTVSLVCAVDANPVASYEWYRNSQPVSNQRQYTFTLSSPDLVGSYTCKATNSRGSVELGYTLSQGNAGNTGASTATSGLSTGEIAAIILAVLLLLILIIIIIICCLTHGACGVICGKKQDVKGRVEPEKEVYKETQKEVIIPRFHEESIKGKREPAKVGSYRSFPARATQYRQPSAVSRKDVDIRVQNGGFRRENDYEIVRYETVPAAPPISTQYITESPRPHHLPALSYTYEDVEKKRKKRRKKKKHHHRRHHGEAEEVVVETVRSASPVRIIQEPVEEVEVVRSASPTRYVAEEGNEMVVERVIRSRSASPTRVIRTEAEEPTVVERVIRSSSPTRVYRQDIEEPVDYPPSPSRRRHGGYYDDERIIETRRSTRSPQRYRRESDEEMIIERRSPSTKRRYEENYITEERYSSGDVVQDDGDLRAYNGVVYREAPSRHSGGHYRVHGSERRSRSRSGRRERGSDDDVEVVYGKEYVVER
ncbi:hemicentin-1-like isoform X2 [Crassostrea angulata]|uniref:hemicentin-1-like isoform X2 n=1 Tax=Magallana angulata TaxID=2784310 RepID=UPI0022B17917|nr:hemicentin-1-like isoform X2 [Crassostrea angulata]